MTATSNGNGTRRFVELANRNLTSNGFDRLEFLPQLRGRRAAELYREMATNDAIVGAILFEIEMVLRRVEWQVTPAGSGPDGEVTDEDVERADFLNTCVMDLSSTWEDVIHDCLTMLPFGFAFLEIVYKKRESPEVTAPAVSRSQYPDGRIGWRKFSLVPAATIEEFETDETGGVQAAIQGGGYGAERVTIPIDKALLFRTDRSNPRGTSILRKVVESWYYRKRIREIEGIGIERDLAGLPVFTVDADILADGARKAEYERMVRNLRRDEQEGVVLPGMIDEDSGKMVPLAELTLLSSGGSRQFDTNEIISRYNREIAMAVLQDVILLGHEKVGTQALASEKRDLSDTALQAWLNDIAAVFNNHAIPRLFALNGESVEFLPCLEPGELRPTDVAEFMTAVKQAADAGFDLAGDPDVENEVRRRLGFDPLREEVFERLENDQIDPPEPPAPVMPGPGPGQPPQDPAQPPST